jgi:hypothetical protein
MHTYNKVVQRNLFEAKQDFKSASRLSDTNKERVDGKYVVLVVISGIRGSSTTANFGGEVESSDHFRVLGIRHAIPISQHLLDSLKAQAIHETHRVKDILLHSSD